MSTTADPAPLYDALAEQYADLFAADREWDVRVHEEPPSWGLGPTPLALMMDRLLAEMDPREAQVIRESAEAEMRLARALDVMEGEVSSDGDEDRPVSGADVDHGPEGPVVVGGDDPGNRDDQGGR